MSVEGSSAQRSSANGFDLPARPGAPLPAPSVPLRRRIGDQTLRATFHLLRPHLREAFAAEAPARLPAWWWEAEDGWRGPLYRIEPRPGATGEPVLLLHGLGGSAADFLIGGEAALAYRLAEAGYAVFLLEHRGDRSALAPPGGAGSGWDLDVLVRRDLEAAIGLIRARLGFARVMWVGHGLGAQLAYLRLALLGEEGIAAGVGIAGACSFPAPLAARLAGMLCQGLDPGAVLPGRRLQQLISPAVDGGQRIGSPDTAGPLARARLRHAGGDLPAGALRQVGRWVCAGELTDAAGRAIVPALPRSPLLLVSPDADPFCPVGSDAALIQAAGAHPLCLEGGWGHLDPLIGRRAPEVTAEIVTFLERWRRRCW